MNVRLVIERDRQRVRVIHLKPPEAVLGRGSGNTVRIPSAEVSRKHCRLQLRDGVVTVEDLESVNGTYLNGQLVVGQALVRPGDQLGVGPVCFVVEYEPTPEALGRLRGGVEPEVLEVDEDVPVLQPADEENDEAIPLVEAVDDGQRVLADDISLRLPAPNEFRDILMQLGEADANTVPRPPSPKVKQVRKDRYDKEN
jgi:pSer/pThr/pTyr-binding forkhead associated (FHA) protein